MKKYQRLSGKPIPQFVDRIHSKLSHKKGWLAAIESESGEYVLEKTLFKAVSKARQTFPNKVFYIVRIGYEYVLTQTGGLKRLKQ